MSVRESCKSRRAYSIDIMIQLAWMSIIRMQEQKHFISLKGLYIVSHDAESLTKRLYNRSINNLDKEAGPHLHLVVFIQIYRDNSFETLLMPLVNWEAPSQLFLRRTDFENVWPKFFTSIKRTLPTFFREKLRTFLVNQFRNFVHQNDAQGVVGEEEEKHPYTFRGLL